jgi:hypothetical protein
MILWLLPDVFNEVNKHYLETLRINAINNKAFLKFDIEDPKISNWTSQNNKADWEEIFRCWISDATKFKQTNIAKVSGRIVNSNLNLNVPMLTLSDASALISMPCFLTFENAHNDVEFIKCVVDKSARGLITKKIHDAEIVTKGGGIGEVKNEIRNQQNPLILRFKMFVLTDSDCQCLDSPDKEAVDVANLCIERGITYHTLRRRMIENYLPLELLYKNTPTENRENDINFRKVLAFNSLSLEQRFCMHLKKGLVKTHLHSNIYDDIEPEINELLAEGFSRLGDWFSKKELQQLIHQLVYKDQECDELHILACKIKNYLRTPA